MYNNLKGTLQQLFNLIWFCRRTQIPFEVYAFTNSNTALSFPDNSQYADYSSNLLPFKSGDLRLNNMRLLNFFSSKMKVDEEIEMMHALYMVAQVFAPSYSRDLGYIHRIDQPRILDLSSTPLNEAIIAMMDIVPKFKKDTGVQKVNTIFLTDGESNMTRYVYDLKFNADKNEHEQSTIRLGSYNSSGGRNEIIFTDKKTRKTYVLEDKRGSDMTNQLLKILKDRVDGMNLVGFFIAGNGKSGRVDKRIIADLLDKSIWDVVDEVKFVNKNKYLAITSAGYDEYYILPGGNNLQVENGGLSDDLTGASKAKLKSAFGKSMKGKISSRQLLDKFVKLVA